MASVSHPAMVDYQDDLILTCVAYREAIYQFTSHHPRFVYPGMEFELRLVPILIPLPVWVILSVPVILSVRSRSSHVSRLLCSVIFQVFIRWLSESALATIFVNIDYH